MGADGPKRRMGRGRPHAGRPSHGSAWRGDGAALLLALADRPDP
jgi:hypothetical protein